MFTKLGLSVLAIGVFGLGCSSEQPTAPSLAQMNENLNRSENSASDVGDGYHDGMVMFTVRIENVSTLMTLHLSNGETAPAPHSPGVWTVTRLKNPLFKIGQMDLGLGLEQQAEDGDPSGLAMSMENDPWVKSTGVFNTPVGDAGPGPATPGKAYEFTISAMPGDHLSFTTMFGQSNDLFYSPWCSVVQRD